MMSLMMSSLISTDVGGNEEDVAGLVETKEVPEYERPSKACIDRNELEKKNWGETLRGKCLQLKECNKSTKSKQLASNML